MRKTIVLILVLASFAACDLTKLEPAQTNSFMKHFGANGNTEAADLLKVSDGYLILGNNSNGDFANVTTVLLKTDLNGNLMWKNQYENFRGRSLTTDGSSYFLVGDGIDGNNPSTMTLIKTDLQGVASTNTTAGQAGFNFQGYGSLISRAGELIVTGRMVPISGATDSTFIYGYNTTDLSGAWTEPRTSYRDGNTIIPSNVLIEEADDLFTYNQVRTNTSSQNILEVVKKKKDTGGTDPDIGFPLVDYIISSTPGGFTQDSQGDLALVQTVIDGGLSKIGFANDVNGVNETILNSDDTSNDYFAGSLAPSVNGYVVVGSTNNVDKTGDLSTRTDTDFFVQQVSYTGQLESDGFTKIFGGTGSEEGKDIVVADDGGIVILGTMTNSNQAKTLVLVKLTSKGELIN